MQDPDGGARKQMVGGLGWIAVLVTAASLLGRSASLQALAASAIVTAGIAALLLVSFSARDIARALIGAFSRPATREAAQRAARVWEAAARSAWVLSALIAIAGFASIVSSDPGGVDRFLGAVGEGAAGVAWGVVLTALLALPALRLSRLAEGAADSDAATTGGPRPPGGGRWERLLGYFLFALLAALPFLASGGQSGSGAARWILHGPAWLMVCGGALALALYLGETSRGGSFTSGFAAAGLIGGILGLTEALHGFLTIRIEDVAGGLAFAISSCCAALVGLAALGLPLEDRSFVEDAGSMKSAATRWAWYGYPLFALLVLVITVLLVMVPIERKVG